MPLIKVSPWDVTVDLCDVLQIWSDYLNGKRLNSAPEVLASWEWLTNSGLDIPSDAIELQDLAGLRVLSQSAGEIAAQSSQTTARDIANANSVANSVNSYLSSQCNLQIDGATPPVGPNGNNPLAPAPPAIGAALPVNLLPATGLAPNADDYGQLDVNYPVASLSSAEQALTGGQLEADYFIPPPPDPQTATNSNWDGIDGYYIPPPPGGGT